MMSQALYRKYRPMDWDEVSSQDHVVTTLRNAVATGRVGHAYLFAGPRGTGKTTVARLLAKALNCVHPDTSSRPDNECANCQAVNEGRFLDLIEIDAASNNGVDDVRDLRDKVNFSPSLGRYRVYIIDEVHMLSMPAFNALLKTLEEPPPHVVFVLATTELHKIPATVLSRCQRHEFRRVPVDSIVANLQKVAAMEHIEAEADALRLIARQAAGSVRDAQSLLDQLASAGGRVTVETAEIVLGAAPSETVLRLVSPALDGDAKAAMEGLQKALDGGADPRTLGRQVVDYLRGVLLVQTGNPDQVPATAEIKNQMRLHAGAHSRADLLRLIRLFREAAAEIRGAGPASLGLELAVAEAADLPSAVRSAARPPSDPAASGARPELAPASTAAKPSGTPYRADAGSEAEPTRPAIQAGRAVTAADVRRIWKDLSHVLAKPHGKLAALMNSVRIIEVQGSTLMLAFASDVLARQFEKPDYLAVLSQAIEEATGARLSIRAVVTNARGQLPPDIAENGMVAAALDSGGEIVDLQD